MKLARSRWRDNIEIRRWLHGFAKAEPQPTPQRPAANGEDARMGWAELVRRGRLSQGGSSSEGGFDGACAGARCGLNAAVAPPTKRTSDGLRHMPKVALLESRPDRALLQRRQGRSPPGGRQNSSPDDVLGAALKRRAEGPTGTRNILEGEAQTKARGPCDRSLKLSLIHI